MGYAIAKMAARRGAAVTLVTGQTALKDPQFADVVPVKSAKDMFDEVTARAAEQDIIIKAAAVADYRPKYVSEQKMKKQDGNLVIELERTDDILANLGENRQPGQFLCGFAMETENLLENSRKKLEKKHLDMIVANSLRVEGAGFGGDTNVVTMITEEEEISLGKMSKEETASHILDQIMKMRQSRENRN
jgi:phosphopantothenoylcysteine decarboxylase/phosphopantothenate--cysteine ligase